MKNCGRRNVRKHQEIKNGYNYITLDISLKFGSLDKMKITSSEPKGYLISLGKGFITSLGLNTIQMSNKNKKARYAINNISVKDLSKIIDQFENMSYEGYVQKESKT